MPPTQANRPLKVATPLPADTLLLTKFEGSEAISQLFTFRLELLALNGTKIPFDKLLGHSATVQLRLADGKQRYFNGIISKFSQGGRDEVFTRYEAEVVPTFWLLARRVQSRIFQHLSIPAILKEVLAPLKVTYDIHGTYQPRDFCVQYRESDFTFASRLMEEEGIYYYFKHTDGAHEMVVTDVPNKHPDVPAPTTVIYDEVTGGTREDARITAWKKTQELSYGKYILWDHCFELPHKHLEAEQRIPETVAVGKVTHKLQVGGNDKLEIFDYPGGYAQRFDGIGKGGDPKPADLQEIFKDNERTAKIRMEQETVSSLEIEGAGNYGNFTAGHQFTLTKHFDADGPYLLTTVKHTARLSGDFRSGDDGTMEYENDFTAIPAALPYRPVCELSKPQIGGTQTATVVGPAGEEIFCDKYGRVKVQFHWDRQGKWDADSSCWVRVSQAWAGGTFGAVCIPRVGQEVVVAFDEADPDQPVILGSVYNAGQMPPFALPEHRTFSAIKTNSVGGKPHENFSGIAFNDKPGNEHVALYAEKDMMQNAENNNQHHVGNYQHAKIGKMSLTVVGGLPGLGGGSGGGGGPGASGTTAEGDTVTDGQITDIAPKPTPAPTDATGQPDTTPSFGNWKTSDGKLASVPGLAGGTVYGINSQDTIGFTHQITIGAAYQLCIDPLGFFGFIPGIAASPPGLAALGAVGGNLQLFWGTNTQAVYGAAVNINHGPVLNITGKPSGATMAMAVLVPVLCAAYEVAFAAMDAEQRHDAAPIAIGAIAIAAIGVLLAAEGADQANRNAVEAAKAVEDGTKAVTALGLAGSALVDEVPAVLKVQAQAAVQASKARPLTPADQAHNVTFVEGVMLHVANHIHQIARRDATDTAAGSPSTIFINAAGDGTDGVAFINATKGMALSSGGGLLELDFKDASSGDITMQCGATGTIDIRREKLDGWQRIKMTTDKILVDGGTTTAIEMKIIGETSLKMTPQSGITLEAGPTDSITLKCGPQSIVVDKTGVTIDGINIQTTAKVQHKLETQMEQVKASIANITRTLAAHK